MNLFLANENIPSASVRLLRQMGFAIVAVAESFPGATDEAVLDHAAKNQMILLTFDRDYSGVIYERQLPPPLAIIYFRFTPSAPEEAAEMLMELLKEEEIILNGRFTVIERGRIRQRLLPKMKRREIIS